MRLRSRRWAEAKILNHGTEGSFLKAFTGDFNRAAGVLAPLASLPSRHGIGDLGPEAYRFVDWLSSAGILWWQMLPVGPLGAGNSPYASSSAFAGEPLYLSLDAFAEEGLLKRSDISPPAELKTGNIKYARVRSFKEPLLRRAFSAWQEAGETHEVDAFAENEFHWLSAWCESFGDDYGYARFLQHAFQRQWRKLREYAASKGVRLMGDAPIFVAADSIDVALSPELFRLDGDGRPEVVSGCPPDGMNPDGQFWGHPHYDWDAHRASNFGWWRARMRRQIDLFDAVRIDHFIGFRNVWEIPANASGGAADGRWVDTPGEELLDAIKDELGGLPLIAEDLGSVTEEVLALRDAYGLPGMRVLQWGFSPNSFHAPQAVPENAVVYPATHDNDTCVGWWRGLSAEEKKRFRVATKGEALSVAQDMWRTACMTHAHTAIVQLQDLLALGRATRTNTPGTPTGNWVWRASRGDLSRPRARRLRELLTATDRAVNQ